jgi:hypothetical protein
LAQLKTEVAVLEKEISAKIREAQVQVIEAEQTEHDPEENIIYLNDESDESPRKSRGR